VKPRHLAAVLLLGCAGAFAADKVPLPSSEELAKLYSEDQADRSGGPGAKIDWSAVSLRDEQRELRVKQLLAAGPLGSGEAYYHAAMVLQHASEPDDYLLAHDLCVIAISKGEPKAKWLAAASLDRYLISIARPQRYGTQFRGTNNHPPRLAPIDPTVSDTLRQELDVPTLAEARLKEADMVKFFEKAQAEKAKLAN
jgi:hypothetical protein